MNDTSGTGMHGASGMGTPPGGGDGGPFRDQGRRAGPEPPASMFGLILPVLGGVTVLVVCFVVYLAMNRPTDLSVRTPQLMPSRQDLGLGERQPQNYGNPSEGRSSGSDLSRSSGGISGSRFGGLIFPLSTSTLKTESDWRNKEAELSSNASGGDLKAMWHLAQLYESRGCPFRDDAQAVMMLQQAAQAGYPVAHYELGLRYEHGRGVTQDNNEALEHFKKADAGGLSNAKRSIELLEEKMQGGSY